MFVMYLVFFVKLICFYQETTIFDQGKKKFTIFMEYSKFTNIFYFNFVAK